MTPEGLDAPVADEEDAARRVVEVINVAPKAIKTDEEYQFGMAWLGSVVTRRKKIEAFFESLKKPLRVAVKVAQDKEKAILAPLEEEETKLKRLTGAYFMEQRRIEQEKQAKENAKHEQKVAKAIEAGKDPANIAPPKVIDTAPAQTVKSDGGPTVTMRMVKNWRVTKVPTVNQQSLGKTYLSDHPALAEIPASCWLLDTARANAAAKSGMTPALELYDVPSQAVTG